MANKSHMASEFYIDLSNAIFVLEQEEVSFSLKEDLERLGAGESKRGHQRNTNRKAADVQKW